MPSAYEVKDGDGGLPANPMRQQHFCGVKQTGCVTPSKVSMTGILIEITDQTDGMLSGPHPYSWHRLSCCALQISRLLRKASAIPSLAFFERLKMRPEFAVHAPLSSVKKPILADT